MGTVYAAEHVRLRRPVAVKVMAAHLADDTSALARFRREAEIISQLHHPHVVQVLDFDTTPAGQPYLVMEMLRGRSLDQILATQSRLGVAASLRIAIQAASALSIAHAAGIVHRDLKPANIFLVDTGDQLFVKVLDFGISKRTEEAPRSRKLTGEFDILGTPDYMAPEQALGRTALVDHRGDQYALAVILFEMLAGQVPFLGNDVMDLLQKVISEPAPHVSHFRSDVPHRLDHILQTALAKTPEARFDSIAEFADELEAVAAELVVGSSGMARRSDAERLRIGDLAVLGPTVPPTGGPTIRPHAPSSQASSVPPRTSWHTGDPMEVVRDLIARVRQELGIDNLELALSCAESAIEVAQTSPNSPEVLMLVQQNARLFQRVFEQKLGDLGARIVLASTTESSKGLTPEQAFLLSRLEGGCTIEEAIDLSPLSRELTLSQLVGLLRDGHIELERPPRRAV